MSIMQGILAGGQGLAGGINNFYAGFNDAQAKAEAADFLRRNPQLFGAQQPQTLASLGQPMPMQAPQPAPFTPVSTDGNAQTTSPYTGPTLGQKPAQGVAGQFAEEMANRWKNQPGSLTNALLAQPGTMTPDRAFSAITPPARAKPASYANAQSKALYDAAISRGYSPVAAAAFVGAGAMPESSLNPNARNPGDGRDGSDSIGMFQWNADRAKRLMQFAAQSGRSWNDPQVQAAFALNELDTTEGRAGQMLRAAQTPEQATNAMLAYLRPGGYTTNNPQGVPSYNARLNNTNGLAAAFAGAPSAPVQPLANIQPMGGAPAQAPVALAQLGQPQAQFTPEQLGQMMTNPYLAPIAQQVVARQLGRDPMQQAQAAAQLEAIQLQNQQRRAEMAGEGQRLNQVDLGDKVGFVNQRGEVVRTIDKAERPIVVDNQLVNPRTGQPVNPGGQQNAPKLTEQQSKDLVYYNRGVGAEQNLAPVEQALTSFGQTSLNAIPGVGNMLTSDQFQKANQAGRDILASILRKDTGAAVTAQEMDLYGKMYLPQPGDGSAVLEQKREARQRALEAIRAGLGKAEVLAASRPKAPTQAPIGSASPAQPSGAPQAPASDAISKAREAIRAGAPREAVIRRLRENGIDPSGL